MRHTLILLFLFYANTCIADTWTQKASLPGGPREWTVSFSIGNKGYMGTGWNPATMTGYKDFWEWSPATNIWTQKADFIEIRIGAAGFSIGNKGYIVSGAEPALRNDLWEYDPATDSWTQKASLPVGGKTSAVAFSIGNKGYFGTGNPNGLGNGGSDDFWEWDGDTASATYNTWTQKADFPAGDRAGAVGFSIGNKGYIGTGCDYTCSTNFNDFWEWNQATNTWTQKTNFGGGIRGAAVGFSIGMNGYIGTGTDGSNKKDFWLWDGNTASATYNTWIQKVDFGGAHRYAATGFSMGNKGYLGMGFFFTVSTDDFWEYCDTCSGVGIHELNAGDNIFIYPNPANKKIIVTSTMAFKNAKAVLYSLTGEKVFEKEFRENTFSFTIDVAEYRKGIYFLSLIDEKTSLTEKVIIE